MIEPLLHTAVIMRLFALYILPCINDVSNCYIYFIGPSVWWSKVHMFTQSNMHTDLYEISTLFNKPIIYFTGPSVWWSKVTQSNMHADLYEISTRFNKAIRLNIVGYRLSLRVTGKRLSASILLGLSQIYLHS